MPTDEYIRRPNGMLLCDVCHHWKGKHGSSSTSKGRIGRRVDAFRSAIVHDFILATAGGSQSGSLQARVLPFRLAAPGTFFSSSYYPAGIDSQDNKHEGSFHREF
jgi:hypothetical protein